MQETRETALQVRKPQWLLTSAEREDEVNPPAPARLATLNTVGQHEKEGTRLMREARPFVKDAAKNEALFRFRSLLLLRSGGNRLHALDSEHDRQHEQQHGENRL